MPQNSLGFDLVNPSTHALSAASLDNQAVSQLFAQGLNTALNVTSARVVKTGAGRAVRVILTVAGSAGTLVLNDCATTGAASAANQIYNSTGVLAAGTIVTLDFPVSVGLVVSAVPTGATLVIVYT
jgi:hypothetical protein